MEDIEDDNEDGFFVGHGVLDKDEARHEDDSDEEVTIMSNKEFFERVMQHVLYILQELINTRFVRALRALPRDPEGF